MDIFDEIASQGDIFDEIAAETKPKSYIDTIESRAKKLGVGVEASLAAITGATSWIPGGLYMAGSVNTPYFLQGPDNQRELAETALKIQSALTYEPKIFPKEAQEQLKPIEAPFRFISETASKTSDVVYEKTGSPALATTAKVAIEAIPFVVPGLLAKGFKGKIGAFAKDAAKDATKVQEEIKFLSPDAQKVNDMFNIADAELEALRKPTVKGAIEKAKRLGIDVSGNIKKELLDQGGEFGKEAVINHDLIRGSSSKAEMITKKALEVINKDLSKNEQKLLDRVIQSRRTIEIDKYKSYPLFPELAEIQHPGGLGLKEHQAFLGSIPPQLLQKINERAGIYFDTMKGQLKDLYDNGILTQESYNKLSQYVYSPRKFIQYLDPETTIQAGNKKITVTDSGIQALDEGSLKSLENNSRALLGQVVTRTQARIFRNDANRALYELSRQLPDNGIVKMADIERISENGEKIFKKAQAGYEKVGVMINGKPEAMLMPSKFAREWLVSDPAVNSHTANLIGWLSGAKILKAMATGLNPEFALTNILRDIQHIWFTTHEYSTHLPVFAGQIAKDIVTVAKDAWKKKGRWEDYINEAGGMAFLTHQGRITSKVTGKLSKLQDVLGKLGEFSEALTRLAVRERAIKNGKSSIEATWEARNYLDFSQGGQFIKAVDTAVPYLNASVQATRGLFRAAKQNPKEFIYKSAQLGTLATGLYLANRLLNPETWSQVRMRDKVNNFIITTPISYNDKEGNKRYFYFKIPKDQSQRIVCSVFENLMAKFLGDKVDAREITQSAQDFVPIMPTETLPPIWDIIMGYAGNIDFWTNEQIWKGPKVRASEEYTRYTHPAFVKIGEVTGLSPERSKYALRQLFTYGNIYSSLVGGGFSLLFQDLNEKQKSKVFADTVRSLPFLRRMMSSTDPYTQHESYIEKQKLEETTRTFKQNRELDTLADKYLENKVSADYKKVREYINQQPQSDRERLYRRFDDTKKLYGIPDRRWWLSIMNTSPEMRATLYWARYSQTDDEEKKKLNKYANQIHGFASERFWIRFNILKRKNIKAMKENVPTKDVFDEISQEDIFDMIQNESGEGSND